MDNLTAPSVGFNKKIHKMPELFYEYSSNWFDAANFYVEKQMVFCAYAAQAFSFRSRISPASAGLALPLLNFITWPLRKFNAAALPALKSVTGPGFAAIASSQNFSMAPVSL